MKEEATPANLLNEREQEILRRLFAGLADQQIADELFLSVHTIKWYNRQIYSKLGVKSRTQAIARAQEGAAQENSTLTRPLVSYYLPVQPSLFIGRDREIAEVKQLLGTSRLLTLTGTGGIGKTRLALRVAAEVAETFSEGVCFVDLAPVADRSQVAKTIAEALGVLENPSELLRDTLKRGLAQRELLLLIDNFEHVIEEALLLSELLTSTSRLKVLVTSREPLRLAEEQEYQVPSFSLPEPGATSVARLMASEAGLFFVRRAQMTLPRFETNELNAPAIGQICTRLDGLPLAIELAAARSKLFSPQALLAQLEENEKNAPFRILIGTSRDAPQRQRTLRDSIAWSYNLLAEDEKLLLARMAVFRGSASLEALEYVCGEGLSMDVLAGLVSLVDKNLVRQKETGSTEPRFTMLEMIHEYARERLKASGAEATVRRKHAEYFVALAESAEPALRLASYDHWARRFEWDLENIRAVLQWSLSNEDVTPGVRLAAALCLIWYGSGYHVEGYQWTQRLLAQLDKVPQVYHARFLFCAGHMAFLRDLAAGKQLFQRMLAIAHDLGDREQVAWALAFLGYTRLGEFRTALSNVEESIALFRELHHLPGIAQALNIMGEIVRFSGDDERARGIYEECLTISEQTGETRRILFMCQNLAFIALHENDVERAQDLGRQSILLAHAMNNRLELAKALTAFAGTLEKSGQALRAARALGASERALERLGAFHQLNDKPEVDAIIAAVQAHLDDSAFRTAWAEGRELTLEQAVTQALAE